MSRYIDRDKFIGNIKTDHWGVTNMVEVGIALDKSVADVVEVRHGEWIEQTCEVIGGIMTEGYTCSKCGYQVGDTEDNNYCRHCGAKMDGERSENGK